MESLPKAVLDTVYHEEDMGKHCPEEEEKTSVSLQGAAKEDH